MMQVQSFERKLPLNLHCLLQFTPLKRRIIYFSNWIRRFKLLPGFEYHGRPLVNGSWNVRLKFPFVRILVVPDLFNLRYAVYRVVQRMIIYVSLVRNVWKPDTFVLAGENRYLLIQLGPAIFTPTTGVPTTAVSTSDCVHMSTGYSPCRTPA